LKGRKGRSDSFATAYGHVAIVRFPAVHRLQAEGRLRSRADDARASSHRLNWADCVLEWVKGGNLFRLVDAFGPVFSVCSFGTVKDSVRGQQTQASPRIIWRRAGRCRNTVATIAASRRAGDGTMLRAQDASGRERFEAHKREQAPAHAHSGAKGGALRCVDANVRGQQYN
jgi:hypothetical protein